MNLLGAYTDITAGMKKIRVISARDMHRSVAHLLEVVRR